MHYYCSYPHENTIETLREWKNKCYPAYVMTDKFGNQVFTYDGTKLPGTLLPHDYGRVTRSMFIIMTKLECENQDFDVSLDDVSVCDGVA